MDDRRYLLLILRDLANGHGPQAKERIKKLSDFWFPPKPPEVKVAEEEAKKAPEAAPSVSTGI